MTEKERAKINALPDALRQTAELYLSKELLELPEKPETGKWYRITLKNALCANNEPYHGCFKLGSENKLAIMFCGGGVSINEYTAARPMSIYNKPGTEGFYFDDVFIIADASAGTGLFKNTEENPFRNWSMLFVPYATGDFHCGDGDFPYVSKEGTNELLRHHGYRNYRNMLNTVKAHFYAPEKILVTGYSAGGFGTSLLTDDVMESFPDCSDVTCAVDSALLFYDNWQKVAKEIWKAPETVYERLTGNNLMFDSLKALRKKQGKKVKIMFISSTRDSALVEVQNYLDKGVLVASEDGGVRYESDLRKLCKDLELILENVGIFIFSSPEEHVYPGKNLTQHCIINASNILTVKSDGKNVVEWLFDGVNGKLEKLGLSLLNSNY